MNLEMRYINNDVALIISFVYSSPSLIADQFAILIANKINNAIYIHMLDTLFLVSILSSSHVMILIRIPSA